MSTKTWFLGLFTIWAMFTFVHRMMVRGESLTFVLAYEAGYTLTMLLMSYVLWLLVRWLGVRNTDRSYLSLPLS